MRMPRLFHALLLAALLSLSAPLAAHAQGGCIAGDSSCPAAPELNPAFALEALGVLAGAGLWIRVYTRKRKR